MGYDHREINHQWYTDFDEKTMTVTIELSDERASEVQMTDEEIEAETTIPVKYEVCDVCNGKGKHVNPSIDSHGLSREDFDEDPDFREDYFSGVYDVPCVACHGKRVIPEPNYSRMTEEEAKRVEKFIDEFFNYQREMHREREMGY